MIFLFDTNIPPSLKEAITGHEIIHVLSFPDGNSTKDKIISTIYPVYLHIKEL